MLQMDIYKDDSNNKVRNKHNFQLLLNISRLFQFYLEVVERIKGLDSQEAALLEVLAVILTI